jgi:hypothetical protein
MRNKITNQSSLQAKISKRLLLVITLLFTCNFLVAQTAGPNLPGTGASVVGVGTVAWTNPGNVTANDNVIASANLSSGAITRYLQGTNYGFSIPATSVINGISLTIMRRGSSTSNGISDSTVRLVKAGAVTGSNLASAVVWPSSNTAQTYGGTTNLWGTTWTAADINATNFGAALSATAAGNRTANVDYFQITVYYTPPPTITNFSPGQACTGTSQSVVITGNHFTGATSVTFNGTTASFTVNSNTQITATLPAGASTGTIAVTTPSGTVVSASGFTVNPLPVLPAITGNTSVCIGSTTGLANGVAGGSWSSASPAVATINSSGVVSGIAVGTSLITYTYTNGNGCVNSVSTTITVNPLPVVSAPSTVCLANTAQLSPATGGTWASNNPAVATVDNTGLVTPVGTGSTTFTFTNSTTNCSATTTAITVLTVPVITLQPISQSVCSDSAAIFSVAATGTSLSYQWYKGATPLANAGNISGATSTTLTINPAALSDIASDYYCVVSGSCTTGAASNMVALAVTEKVIITSQPVASQNACAGDTVSIMVAGTGAGLTYQWYNGATLLLDNSFVSGATTATLTISSVATTDSSGNYYCLVSGTSPCTAVASANSALTVNQIPVINTQPAVSQSICTGGSVSFNVGVTGTSLSYQWYKGGSPLANGGNISGATTATLTISPAAIADTATDYYCLVSGNCTTGIASNMAALTVNEQVVITSQPVALQNVCTGQTVLFSVVATGTGLTYQWYNGATLLLDSATISGATTAALTISPIAIGDASNAYHCTVSGASPCAPVTSSNSILTVNNIPNITTNPATSQAVCNGAAATLNMAATGGSLSYQWYKGATLLVNGGNISGATTATLSINPFSGADAATDYYCVVSNLCMSGVTTNAATLALAPQASIQAHTTSTCSQTAFSVTPITGSPSAGTIVPANTQYSWSAPIVTGGMTGGAAQTSQTAITGTLNNPTTTAQTATYTVTPSTGISPTCTGTPFTLTVTVNPKPSILTINAAVCTQNTVTVTPTNGSGNSIPAGTTYSWGLPVVTGGITGPTIGSGSSFSQTLTNPTTNNQTATYSVTPTSGSCAGNPFTIVVTVYAKPVVNANTASQTICHGSAPTIVISNPANVITSYSWTRDNIVNVTGTNSGTSGSIAAGNTFTIANVLTNTTGVPQTVIYTITPTSNGCAGNPITTTVIVSAPSVGGAVTSSLPGVLPAETMITVCHFATGTIYLSGNTGSIVRWEYTTTGGATWIPIAYTGSFYDYLNITQTTLFRAVVRNGGASCSLAYSAIMTVNVVPNIKPNPVVATPSTICAGASSLLTSQSGYATSQYIASGGSFSNANPANWSVDGCGNCLNAGGSNTNPGPFQLSATNGGTYSGINYASVGKFAIANGNFTSILSTPAFNTFGLTTVNLSFDHAFNLLAGAWVTVELSLDGGTSYPVTLATWTGPATRTPYNAFPNTTIDLNAYLGQSNMKVRFVYHGTVGSSWAIDNIQIPDAPNNIQTQWVDSSTGQVISTNATATVSPIVTTTYAITTSLNGCTSFGPEGTTYVTVTVNPRPTATIGVNQTICYGGTATFSIAMTGVAPWNISYSNGTTTTTVNNVVTNPYVFSVNNITANQTYTVTNLSDSRCTATPADLTGSAVVTVLNGTQGLWTGLISTDWFDCRNWAGGLPSLTVNAVIPNGMPRMPMISPATSPYAAAYSNIAQARDIIVGTTASLSMAASGTSNLQVSRDWKNSGTFNPGTGTVTFNSSTANLVQTINVGIKTNETFYNLITNVTNGAKGISVVDNFQLTVSNTLSLLSGDLRLTGEAQLVQAGTAANPTSGTGKLLRDQQGTKSSFNYNYWSSPVSVDGINYSVSGVLRDGSDVITNPFGPLTITFGNGAYFADGVATNPIKISNSWINKYTLVSNDYFSWQFIGSTGNVKIGEGFTMKGTDGTAAITTPQNYVFVGKPNNGTINLSIATGQSYLIGNPYASALDADQFIKDNIKDGGNAATNSFNGALYFWDHFGGHTHLLAQYVGGYATYTLMGGVVAIANSPLNINDGSMGSKVPKRYIPVSQGFFINTNVDPSLTTNNPNLSTPVTGGPIVFKNTQRVFRTESPSSSVFFRNSTVAATPGDDVDTRQKIRLVYVSSAGIYRQILVGADASATDGFDLGYDGPMVDVSADDMYWNVAQGKLAIQAVSDFAPDRIIPLTLKANAAGEASININSLENIGDETNIYLYDNQTGLYHDLKTSAFTIALPAGEHPNRFSVRFATTALGVGENTMNSAFAVTYSNHILNIRNTTENNISSVALFNLAGQKVTTWDIDDQDQRDIRIEVERLAQAAYIVKIVSGNVTESTKIIVD